VRVIAPDRPGCGGSDPKPGRSLLDWPADVRALADSLRIERFSVAGISGGGPYAAVCAWALPERVTGAAILSGIGPSDHPGATRGMLVTNRFSLWLSQRAPPLARALLGLTRSQLRNPERALSRMARALPAPDRAVLAQPVHRDRLIAEFREAISDSTEGAVADLRIFASPWRFAPEQIRVPVHVWHGELDRNSPVALARRLAAAIPGCRTTFGPDGGHLFPLLHLDEVLKSLGL
jgi:pimeloyl-ACP methyl ester carboxylesterase